MAGLGLPSTSSLFEQAGHSPEGLDGLESRAGSLSGDHLTELPPPLLWAITSHALKLPARVGPHPTLEFGNSSCSCSAQSCLHHRVCCISPPSAQLQVGDKSPCMLEESVSPCAACSEPSWATAPQASPAPWEGSWGHQPQSTGHALGVQLHPVKRGGLAPALAVCPVLSCCPWVHGGDVCRACATSIAQLVNGGQHVLGFASHLSVLQAVHMSRDNGLTPLTGNMGVPLCFVTSPWKAPLEHK